MFLSHIMSLKMTQNEKKNNMKTTKRPTILDLANASGVSVSTVNRILSGKGAVRNATMLRVQRAAEQIGYYGLGAIEYRVREASPIYRLGFLLQQSHRPLYQVFSKKIIQACRNRRDEVIEPLVDFVDHLMPETIAARLKALGKECDAVSLIAADHPVIGHAISELAAINKPVVSYISDQSTPKRAAFVGTDNWKLGRTAAYLMTQMIKRPGRIALFIGNHRYQCQDISDASFRSYIREHAPQLYVEESQPTHEEPTKAYNMLKELLMTSDDLIGILIIGGGISGLLRALREVSEERRKEIVLICRDAGPETLKGLSEGLISASLCHPLDITSQVLVDTMIEAIHRDTDDSPIQKAVPFEILTPTNIW